MLNDEGLIQRTWLYQQGHQEGRKEAADGLREMLLLVLRARGLRLTAAQRQRIAQTNDLETLRAWGRAAADAKTAGQALAATPAA